MQPHIFGNLILPCSSAFAQLFWQVLAELGNEQGRERKGLKVDLAFCWAWKDVVIPWSWFGQYPEIFPSPCRLSQPEKDQISAQIGALKETYQALCSNSTEQLQQLQSQLAQETEHKVFAPCSALFTPQGVDMVSFCCVSHGHWPLTASCTWLPSLLFHPWSPKASGGPWRPSRRCFPAAFQVPGRVVLWFPSGLCPLYKGWLVCAW